MTENQRPEFEETYQQGATPVQTFAGPVVAIDLETRTRRGRPVRNVTAPSHNQVNGVTDSVLTPNAPSNQSR